jgi:hypothetical protein
MKSVGEAMAVRAHVRPGLRQGDALPRARRGPPARRARPPDRCWPPSSARRPTASTSS